MTSWLIVGSVMVLLGVWFLVSIHRAPFLPTPYERGMKRTSAAREPDFDNAPHNIHDWQLVRSSIPDWPVLFKYRCCRCRLITRPGAIIPAPHNKECIPWENLPKTERSPQS